MYSEVGKTAKTETTLLTECNTESLTGSETSNSQDPGDFEEHSSQGRKGIDVAELTAMEADIFIKSKNSCIS